MMAILTGVRRYLTVVLIYIRSPLSDETIEFSVASEVCSSLPCRGTRTYTLTTGRLRDKVGSLREQSAQCGVPVPRQLKYSWATLL